MSKGQHHNTNTSPKNSITQQFRTDLGRSGGVTKAIQMVWFKNVVFEQKWCDMNWLFNVTINDISVIYVTAHRCAGGLKKKWGTYGRAPNAIYIS